MSTGILPRLDQTATVMAHATIHALRGFCGEDKDRRFTGLAVFLLQLGLACSDRAGAASLMHLVATQLEAASPEEEDGGEAEA